MSDSQKMMVRIPARLKGKIARAVAKAERSMNDVVVAILAERYSAPFEPVGRKVTKPVGASPSVVLELPPELYAAIKFDAEANGDSMRNMIVKTLSDHFGIPFVATSRWPAATAPRTRSRRPSAGTA